LENILRLALRILKTFIIFLVPSFLNLFNLSPFFLRELFRKPTYDIDDTYYQVNKHTSLELSLYVITVGNKGTAPAHKDITVLGKN
jgi:hypothetical protein